MFARIITTPTCPYCEEAISLLEAIGVPYDKTVLRTQAERDAFKKHHETVPQIWVGKTHIGGCSDLKTFLKEKLLNA